MALEAKAPAYIERDAAHARLRKPQHRGCLAANPMYDLGGRPDGHRICSSIVDADDAAALHRRGGIAVMMKAALQLVRGARKRGIDVALANGECADEVGVESFVDDRRALAQRLLRIDDGRKRIEIETDQLSRVFRRMTTLGHDDGNGLADMADLVVGEKGLLGVDELVLDQRRPFTRQRELRVRHRRQELQEIPAAQGTGDARRTARTRQIHGADARMGERASDEDRVQHVRQIEVGNELSLTGQQAMVLATRQRAADERAFVGIVHARRIVPVIPGCRSAGKFTRPALA